MYDQNEKVNADFVAVTKFICSKLIYDINQIIIDEFVIHLIVRTRYMNNFRINPVKILLKGV